MRDSPRLVASADVPRSGDIAPFAGLSGTRKQPADQLVRHIEHCVGEPCFENDRGDNDRASPLHSIAPHLMRIGDACLADELLKAAFMDPPGSLGWDTDLADAPEPIEQCPHMVGLWCCRGIPQPGEWRRRECRIGYEQRVEFSKLRRGRSASKASAARLRARARPAMAVRSTTVGAGLDVFEQEPQPADHKLWTLPGCC
jgi:hypothetical protein